jgi:ATP-dependent Clp protease ATP-binding subunit ClpA
MPTIPRPVPPRAQAALVRAAELAQSAGEAEVLPRHIILGILAGPGVAVEALSSLGVSIEALAAAVAAHGPLMGDTRRLLEQSVAEADERGHPYLGTEHIVVVMTRDPVFEQLLADHGVTGEQVRDAITAQLVKYGR